jgi:hypothetical protein
MVHVPDFNSKAYTPDNVPASDACNQYRNDACTEREQGPGAKVHQQQPKGPQQNLCKSISIV